MGSPRSESEEATWQEVRREVLKRDGRQCQDRRKSPCEGELHVHHLIPRAVGGPDQASNCITLCSAHHAARHPSLQVSLSRRIVERWALRVARWLDFAGELPAETRALSAALHLFGVSRFKPGQLEVVLAALRGESLLVVRPTGSGKSLCFQLPALLSAPPFTLVLSPLKALMADQVEGLHRRRLPATFINGDVTGTERKARYALLEKQALSLLYVAPERFDPEIANAGEAKRLLEQQPSFLVVDEAHVVDRWGFDFRPSYGRIAPLRNELGSPPVLAFTATAGARTQERIKGSLGIPDARVIVSDADRPNIALCRLSVPAEGERVRIVEGLLGALAGRGKTLLFVPTIKQGEAVQALFAQRGLELPFFHGRLSRERRDQILGGLTGRLEPEIDAVICTSAFSLGVDIPDIRLVVHWQHPASVEDYLQEFGRAGRDGEPALALLLSGTGKEAGLWRFMADRTAEEAGSRGLPKEQIDGARQQRYDAIAETAELAVPGGECFRRALLEALGAGGARARPSLARRILHWVFDEHPRVTAAGVCCDACDPALPQAVELGEFPLQVKVTARSVRPPVLGDENATVDDEQRSVEEVQPAASPQPRVEDPDEGSLSVEASAIELVGRMPGRLSVAMVAHVLWGSEGPKVKANYSGEPEYGRFAEMPHKELRTRVQKMVEEETLSVAPRGGRLRIGS